MPDITMMWANEMMVANDVATMTSGDRLGVGESRCCHSRSVNRRSVAYRAVRISCCRSRDTNTDVMDGGVEMDVTTPARIIVVDATAMTPGAR